MEVTASGSNPSGTHNDAVLLEQSRIEWGVEIFLGTVVKLVTSSAIDIRRCSTFISSQDAHPHPHRLPSSHATLASTAQEV